MIDRKLLLHDFDDTARRLARKGVETAQLQRAADLLQRRAALTHQADELRALVKSLSKEIGDLMRKGAGAEAEAKKTEVSTTKQKLAQVEDELDGTELEVEDALLRIPNLPDDTAPEGATDADNVEVSRHGPDLASFEGRTFRPHWEVAGDLDLYDGERGAKIAGSMFALLKGDGARLLRALVQLALDLNRDRYLEIIPPHFVNSRTFTGTGQLPKFAGDSYRLESDDLWAIPTGEVPLMGMHQGEILDGASLPRRYMTYTACFRREAGSAGKDTRGMQRLHEFHKVEIVKLCREEQVEEEFAEMLEAAQRPLKLLGLPYRMVAQCVGDLPFSAQRVFDLEVWAPGVAKWLEVSSVGVFGDFQARRGDIRYRPEEGKPRFVHAMNGSALATPRVWAALIEHGQQDDGNVVLPEPLHAYMGTDVIRARA